MKRSFFIFSLALIIAGCGSKSLTPLTTAQKAQLKDTTTSTYRAFSASTEARRNRSSGAVSRVAPLLSFLAHSSNPYSSNTLNPDESDAARRMAEALRAECRFPKATVSDSSTGPVSGMPYGGNLHLVVDGDSCPVYLDFDLSAQVSPQGAIHVDLNGTYQLKNADPGFKALNDVIGFSLKGSADLSGNQLTQSVAFSMSGTGEILSQKYGRIGLSVNGGFSGTKQAASGSLTMDFVYPSFTAELKITQQGQEAQYFINDEPVSLQEFLSYFGQSFPVTSTQSPSIGAGTP